MTIQSSDENKGNIMALLKKWLEKKRLIAKEKKEIKEIERFKSSISSCGNNLQLFGIPEISFHKNLNIGNNCKINSNVYLNARSGITIGDNVTLSNGVKIISTGYDIEHWMSTGEKKHTVNAPICIGNNCWIGANAIVLSGVNITGEYVVIGAGAVVTKNITESKVLVAGNPAKIIKHYEQEKQE